MPAEAAACRGLVQVYNSASGNVAALRGIDAVFNVGSVTAIVGPSGAGKSTLLRLLAGLEAPAAGDVVVAGHSTAMLRTRQRRRIMARHIGYVFQRPQDNMFDYLSVAEHVDLAARLRDIAPQEQDTALTIKEAGLMGLAHHKPGELSAGQQQRLAFALARVGGPALVVADEPSAELDPDSCHQLVAQIRQQALEGATFVIATHDPYLIAASDQQIVVERGLATTHETQPIHD